MSISNKTKFRGCYIATLTPFDSTNSLDTGVVEAHCQWLIEQGIDGLCPAGTTGEFLYLTDKEKMLTAAHAVRAAHGNAAVITGVWSTTMAGAQALTSHAADCGADGVFLPPPIYYPASDEVVYCWYSQIAAASRLPVFAYNIPQYAANSISTECLDRLFASGAIAGIKDSTGSIERVSTLVSRYGGAHTVFAASDGFAAEGRRIGADGFISAIGNIAPSLFANLWSGDDSLQPKVDALRKALKQLGSIPALKYLLNASGFSFGESRIPCSEMNTDQKRLLDGLVGDI